ncbi:MAG: hypothetical protein AB1324_02520 [Candidatus Micrarchaeota archaeon]
MQGKNAAGLYPSLRHPDSDVRWKAAHELMALYVAGERIPSSVLAMAFNILNGRAFDLEEPQEVRAACQNDLEKAIDAGIEKLVSVESVISDIASKEAIVRVLAIENLIIACEYGEDIAGAFPALLRALSDRDAAVRKNAAFAFVIAAEHGLEFPDATRKLSALASEDAEEDVRAFAKAAVDTLERMKEGKKAYG